MYEATETFIPVLFTDDCIEEQKHSADVGKPMCSASPAHESIPFLSTAVYLCEGLNAVPVMAVSRQEALANDVFCRHRMKQPLLIRADAHEWPKISVFLNQKNLATRTNVKSPILPSCINGAAECIALIAKDNKNFLKLELCERVQLSVEQAHRRIFDSLESHDSQRLYCRLYLEDHPLLLPHIDLHFIAQLIKDKKYEDPVLNPKNIGVWMSSAGAVTPLHYDLCHGFLAQCIGKKRFILSSPEDYPLMYSVNDNQFKKNGMNSSTARNTCRVDLSQWLDGDEQQRVAYPNISDVTWYVADLEVGDILYTPPGWFHHVTSIDASVSVLIPFDPHPEEHIPPHIAR